MLYRACALLSLSLLENGLVSPSKHEAACDGKPENRAVQSDKAIVRGDGSDHEFECIGRW